MNFAKKQQTVTHAQYLGLLYHDLFDYPLTREELSFWQIGEEEFPKHIVSRTGPFYHLPGKETSTVRREATAFWSRDKWQIAQKAASALSRIPTVSFVGVSGALAMGGASQEDDIDLFIITRKNTLWITRLLSYLVFSLAGLKVRRAGELEVKDKLCLNLWVDEDNLSFGERKDIYTAHEIIQTKGLFERGNAYFKFLEENSWVWQFFPAAQIKAAPKSKKASFLQALAENLTTHFLSRLNYLSFLVQKRHMDKKRTAEEVSRGRAFFHPLPWQSSVPKLFTARLTSFSRKKRADIFSQFVD